MPTGDRQAEADREANGALDSVPRWYHTMELAPGLITPGWFDLRSIVDRLPWPEVRGKRCLDVGPYDGQLAFELERRGAAEVIAADIPDHGGWDWPLLARQSGPAELAAAAGPDPGAGFKLARRLLASRVERIALSVYDLDPERIGRFDLVTCGSLLLHLRDPVRALGAIRSVCRGQLLSAEQISVPLTLARPRTPLAVQHGGARGQWWVPNVAAHRQMLRAAGFRLQRAGRPYAIPLGPGHPARGGRWGARRLGRGLARGLLTGGIGVPHAAVLAAPEPEAGR